MFYFNYNAPSSVKAAAFVSREISLCGWVQSVKTKVLTLCVAKKRLKNRMKMELFGFNFNLKYILRAI